MSNLLFMQLIYILFVVGSLLYIENRVLANKNKKLRKQLKASKKQVDKISKKLGKIKKKRNTRTNARRKKQTLINQRGLVCEYCNQAVNSNLLTVDHYVPLSKGGSNKISNLKLSCITCNTLKGDMAPEEWVENKLFGSVS